MSSPEPGTRRDSPPAELAARLLTGDRLALSRMISAVERGQADARAVLPEIYAHTGSAHVVGITGPPGSGKSTLVTRLAAEERKRGRTIAVVAVDPSSPFTGGAILGDRVRMMELHDDPGVFVRSMATRGSLGGLARSTMEVIALMDASGRDMILVETVGVGQDEVEIARAADTTLVVGVPGLGDDIQAIKAGILEIADILVVNKADLPGADRVVADLRGMLSLGTARAWTPPILQTAAGRDEGIGALADNIDEHGAYLLESGKRNERRVQNARRQVRALVEDRVRELFEHTVRDSVWEDSFMSIARRDRDPYTVAEALLGRLLASSAVHTDHPIPPIMHPVDGDY